MKERTPIFAANWKMNKLASELSDFIFHLQKEDLSSLSKAEYVLAPQFVHIGSILELVKKTPIQVFAQNCGTDKSGAFTGEVSPLALRELGCQGVILGHSERRHVFGEGDALISKRIKAALGEGLSVLFCVGEKIEERKAGKTFQVLDTQLSVLKELSALGKLSIAYEPVWAIGTGENATPEQAQIAHGHIRNWIALSFSKQVSEFTRILYGGSVKPENANGIMSQDQIDGFLVGGASLDPDSFANIVRNSLLSKVKEGTA